MAVVERERQVGGACVTTGTLPSKTLRQQVHTLTSLKQRFAGGRGLHRITMGELLERKSEVVKHEIEILTGQLERNHIQVLKGCGRFVSERSIEVTGRAGQKSTFNADYFVIATGSRPAPPPWLKEPDPRIIDSDTVLDLEHLPRTMTVLGGGVIGCEYACIFARLGVKVTLIDRRERLLRFMDSELTDALAFHMRAMDITLKLGEDIEDISFLDRDWDDDAPLGDGAIDSRVQTRLRSGKLVRTDQLFVALGRQANTANLGLDELGLEMTPRGLIKVDGEYRTAQKHIFAVGDVIGFPALASTSMEQGRLAACDAFGEEPTSLSDAFPYGIYTIPEMSYVGANEEELTKAEVPYEIGRAEFSETARGQILGDRAGVLKLLFHRETLELLGVHIIGESATELVHIGQAVLAHKGKVTYFIDTVFNYPTLAEAYKIAALNGVNRL